MHRCDVGMGIMGNDEVECVGEAVVWRYLHEEAVLQRGDVLAVSARLGWEKQLNQLAGGNLRRGPARRDSHSLMG